MAPDSKTPTTEEKLIAKVEEFRNAKPADNYREFMIWLAEKGDLETLRLILDTNTIDPKQASFLIGLFGGFTHPIGGHVSYLRLLRAAAQNGQLEVVKYFVNEKKVSVSEKDKGDRDLMQVAVEAGQLEVVRYLVETCGVEINNNSIIKLAIQKGKTDVVAYLLQKRALAQDEKSDEQKTTWSARAIANLLRLHKHAKAEDDMLVDCARIGDLETFRILAELVSPNVQRDTALMAAAESGHQAVVEYLLPKPASANESVDESKEDDHQANAVKLIELCQGKPFKEMMCDSLLRGNIGTIQFLNSLGLMDVLVDEAIKTGELKALGFLIDSTTDQHPIEPKDTDITRMCDMAFAKSNVEWLAYFLEMKIKKGPEELKALAEKIIELGSGKATCREAVQSFLDQGNFKSVDQFFEAGVGFEDIWGLFDTAIQKDRLDVVEYLQRRMGWSSFNAYEKCHKLGSSGLTNPEFCQRSELLTQMAANMQHVKILGYLLQAKCRLPVSFVLLDYIDKGLKETVICVCKYEKKAISPSEIEEIFQLARQHGSVNAALFHCATTGNLESIQLLVKIGAKPRDCRLGNKTLLETATEAGHLPVVQHLMVSCKLNIKEFSFSSFQRVIANGHQLVVNYLYGKCQELGDRNKKIGSSRPILSAISKYLPPKKSAEANEGDVKEDNYPFFQQNEDLIRLYAGFELTKLQALARILSFFFVYQEMPLNRQLFERFLQYPQIEAIELCFQFLSVQEAEFSYLYLSHAVLNIGANKAFKILQQFFVMPLSDYALRYEAQCIVQSLAQNQSWIDLPVALLLEIADYLVVDGKETFRSSASPEKSSSFSKSFLGFFNNKSRSEDPYEDPSTFLQRTAIPVSPHLSVLYLPLPPSSKIVSALKLGT